MDQNNQPNRFGYQRPPIIQNLTNINLPTVKQLFTQSWQDLKKNLLPLFIITSIGIASYASIGVLTMVIFVMIGFIPIITGVAFSVLTFAVLALAMIGTILISNTLLGACILLLNESKNLQLQNLLSRTLKTGPLLFLFILIATIIIVGGTFLFVIPGILFAVFFIFTPIIMLTENQSLIFSLRRSVYLATKSFGEIFIRLLLLILIPFITSLAFQSIFTSNDLNNLILSILNLVFNLLYFWFALSFIVNLYKEVKTNSNAQEVARIRPLILISLIGWILGGCLLTLLYFNPAALNSIIAIDSEDETIISEQSIIDNSDLDIEEPILPEILLEEEAATPSASVAPQRSASPSASVR